MKITAFDEVYSRNLSTGITYIGGSSGSNSGFAGGDVVGEPGSLSVISLRNVVSLASNMGDNTLGSVLTTIQSSPWVAEFAVPSNTGSAQLPWFIVTAAAYGATGNGTTDDTAAINLAIAALNTATKGVLYFPAGTYKVSAALTTITATGIVMGDGMAASRITCTSTTAYLFEASGTEVVFRDLHLINSRTGTPSAGGAIRATGGRRNRYDRLLIEDFYVGIRQEAGVTWGIDGCYIGGCDKYSVHVSNAAIPDEGDWSIANSAFADGLRSSDAAIHIDSSGGGKIVNCKINSDNTIGFLDGIVVSISTGNDTSILLVANSSIEGLRGDAIKVVTTGSGQYAHVTVVGCQVGLFNNTGRAVKITAAAAGGVGTAGGFGLAVITGCTFRTNGTARAAIELTNTDRVTIGDLTLLGFNARYTSSGDTNTIDGASISYATPAIVLGTAAAAGAASTVIRSDATIVAFDATVPVTQTFGDTAATGSAAVAAHRDHVHGMPATPSGAAHYLVIASSHSTPLVFGDLVQSTGGSDLIYTS